MLLPIRRRCRELKTLRSEISGMQAEEQITATVNIKNLKGDVDVCTWIIYFQSSC